MIIKLRAHPTAPTIVVIHAGPELAHTMGGFQPARWQPASKTYWVEDEHVEAFERFARIHHHTIVDERHTIDRASEEKFIGPLPECANCGQPASRQAALTMSICPACGATWHIADLGVTATGREKPKATCGSCAHVQGAGFTFCSACGATMPAAVPGGRPLLPLPALPREPLEDPLALSQVLSEQLPIDAMEATP